MTTTTPTHGSLFTGYGGLDLAIEEVFGARTVWNSDIEPGPRKVLAHRYPDVPNLGDITRVDWTQVEPVDIIAGGSPCQDISSAGRMAGMREGTRSNLWVAMREAIRVLQPRYVIWENVRGALSTQAASAMESDPRLLGDHPNAQPVLRALGRVLGDLANLGFDAEWHGLRAADIGAPHGRFRIFVVAANPAHVRHERRRPSRVGWAGPADSGLGPLTLLPTPTAQAAKHAGDDRGAGTLDDHNLWSVATRLLPTPTTRDHKGRNQRNDDTCLTGALLPTPRSTDKLRSRSAATERRVAEGRAYLSEAAVSIDWGSYAAAIARWEAINGPAPAPTKPGRNGRPKLNPAFAEWLMGAPAGWITDVPGVTDTEALRMAGNGVVRQQAVAALRLMLNRMETRGAETRSPCQKRDQP